VFTDPPSQTPAVIHMSTGMTKSWSGQFGLAAALGLALVSSQVSSRQFAMSNGKSRGRDSW
jgi:hypothetical protein